MSYIDDILSAKLAEKTPAGNEPLTVDGKPVGSQEWLDPDTVKVDGKPVRIKGYNAPEVEHIKGGVFTPREVLNDTSQQDVQGVIKQGGYTNIVSGGKDKYVRVVGDLQNPSQESLGDTLTKLGIQETNSFSNPKAVADGITMRAAAGLFPELASKDPLVSLGMQRQEERKGQYAPRVSVADEKAYAGFKGAIGVGPAADYAKEVERLEGILKDQSLRPALRVKLSKELDEAKRAVFIASTTPDVVGNVLIRHDDRTIMNKAHDQFTTSLSSALLDSLKSVGGILEIAGDTAKWEWLSGQGQVISKKAKLQQGDLPDTLNSFREISTDNTWDTIKDTGTYVGNLFAGTLPSMAILVGSTMATGGIGGAAAFGLSAVPPSLMYAGNFYADQEKKNAGLAMALGITSGVLDRVGLEGMMGGNLFTITGKDMIINKIIQAGKAANKQDAMKILEEASKKELVELSEVGAEFAKHQYASKEAMMRGVGTLASQVGSEAGTESAQQLAEMVAKKGEWNLDAQYDKGFYDQLLDAAVGGGTMAGTIGTAMQTKDNAQWHSIADGLKPFDGTLSEAQQYQAENRARLNDLSLDEDGNKKTGVGYASIEDAAMQNKYTSDDTGNRKTLNDIQTKTGMWNSIKSIVTDPGRLLRQLAHTAVPSIMNEDGTFKENLAVVKAIMGGYGILPGDHAAGYKQRLMGRWHGSTAESLANDLNTSVKDANARVRETWQDVWSKGGRLEDNSPLQKWFDSIENIRQDILSKSEGYVDVTDVLNTSDLFESATINPQHLKENRERVIQTMINSGKSNRRQAAEAIHNIISGDYHKAAQAKKFMSQAGVFKDTSLNDVFETNVFSSIESLKERMANHLMQTKFIGRDGEILAKLLLKAKENKEFKDDAEFDNTAKEVKDWFDIMSGNYHPLDNYPRLEKLLGWGATLTMLASLSKAAISSQVEVAMSTLGTPAELINKQLGVYAKTYAAEYANDVNKFNSWTLSTIGISSLRKVTDRKVLKRIGELESKLSQNLYAKELEDIQGELDTMYKAQFGRRLFEHLGYNDTGYNSMGKFEYNDSNMRQAMHVFASAISLRAQTDSTRMAVLSVAADTVLGKLMSLMQIDPELRQAAFASGKGMSKEQMQSLAELQQYGMDVYGMTQAIDIMGTETASNLLMNGDVLTNNGEGILPDQIKDNLLTTLGNMVDARVVNPQAHNLPKYFHDPRLRVVTIMGRFMAAAHAVILPRLYKQYLLDGNVGMKYQAFSTVAMALLFGHLANILKDMISYEDDNPYVKGTRKNIQRVINSSGLLGQYEKIVDKVAPVYPNSGPDFSKNPVGWTVDKVTDASPVASWAAKPVRGVYNLANGDTEKGVKQLVRAAPVVGSFPVAAGNIASLFKE